MRFSSTYTLTDREVLLLPATEGEDTIETIEIIPVRGRRLMKKLNQHKDDGPINISPFLLRVRRGPGQTVGDV